MCIASGCVAQRKASSLRITFIAVNYRRFVFTFSSYCACIIIYAFHWNEIVEETRTKNFSSVRKKLKDQHENRETTSTGHWKPVYSLVQVLHSSRRYHAITAATAATSVVSVSISKETVFTCVRIFAHLLLLNRCRIKSLKENDILQLARARKFQTIASFSVLWFTANYLFSIVRDIKEYHSTRIFWYKNKIYNYICYVLSDII